MKRQIACPLTSADISAMQPKSNISGVKVIERHRKSLIKYNNERNYNRTQNKTKMAAA